MLALAADGDGAQVTKWVRDARSSRDPGAVVAVLHAVCDAIVADAFRSRGDIAGVGALIASLECDIVRQLTTEQQRTTPAAHSASSSAEIVRGLIDLAGMHDRRATSHHEESAVFARRIAIELDLPQEQIGTVELAAQLHDIGHVGVSAEILAKPGALTPEELVEVRGHVEIGSALLRDMPTLAHLAPIVRAHHERIDGRGYPDNLRGDEIPLESRIIAVADAVAAMTSPRPYRPTLQLADAVAAVGQRAGTQFDIDVVGAAFGVFRNAHGYREIA